MPIKIAGITAYTVPEICKQLGVSSLTLRKYLNEKRLVGQKIGRRWMVTEENLRDFLNARSGVEKKKE